MPFEEDDEILQDFLTEAGEILELLGEQLVELEQSPQDYDLLNAVFRGFHTIKGGAGFLSIKPLVEICHRAEDVFNVLRQGERIIDAKLMDVILKVVDVVNDMFKSVRQHEMPVQADPALHAQLEAYTTPDSRAGVLEESQVERVITDVEQVNEVEKIDVAKTNISGDVISDDEFESLLNDLHGKVAPGAVSESVEDIDVESNKDMESDADDITDDEFEALLNQLHGDGPPKGVIAEAEGKTVPVALQKEEEVSTYNKAEKEAKVVKIPGMDKSSDKQEKPSAAQLQGETTVRVDTKRLDEIMNLVGELVLSRNRLTTLEANKTDDELAKAVANLDLITSDLQSSVMRTRMQPIKKVFGRFPRVVRDLARSLDKDIVLEMRGEDTDLDKNLVEALADPLVHLVRNSVDHGIERPDVREAMGKPRQGKVELSAQQQGDHILLTIADDGAGIDPDKLRKLAVDKGLMDIDMAARLSKNECFNLIFMPGFSTKQEISDISGRGVGMDVVKTKITQLNGSIHIDSEIGKGSILSIKLPLTLAIMPTLMVMLGEQIFALPLASVIEIFDLDLSKINIVDGQRVVIIRNKPLPIFDLKKWLVLNGSKDDSKDHGHVVVVSTGGQQVGFVVDQLIGQEEVVIKPLGALLHGTKGLAGATITGNGRISLILDVPELILNYANKH